MESASAGAQIELFPGDAIFDNGCGQRQAGTEVEAAGPNLKRNLDRNSAKAAWHGPAAVAAEAGRIQTEESGKSAPVR